MQLERKHIYAAAGAAVVLVIVIIAFMYSGHSKPEPSEFGRCDNSTATLDDFQISGCAEARKSRCKLQRGKQLELTLKFNSSK